MVRLIELLFAAPLAAMAAVILFAETMWLGDLLVFFLPWVALVALLILVVALAIHWRILGVSAALLVIVAGVMIARAYEPPLAIEGRPLRVLTFNTLAGNGPPADLAAFINEQAPDIVALQEVYPAYTDAVAAGLVGYPYRSEILVASRRADLHILSRYPVLNAAYIDDGSNRENAFRILRVEIDFAGTTIAFYATHAPTPRFDQSDWEARNAMLITLADAVAAEDPGRVTIVAGDFNTPPWSPHFRELLRTADLSDTAGRLIPLATRLIHRPGIPSSFGSPVDHVLVSAGVGWAALTLGPALGSDHRPVLTNLSIP